MTRKRIMFLGSIGFFNFALFISAELCQNNLFSNIFLLIQVIFGTIVMAYTVKRTKDKRIKYFILFLAFIFWTLSDVLIFSQKVFHVNIISNTFYNSSLLSMHFAADVLIATALLIFYKFKKKNVYRFQLFLDNIAVLECSLGLLWIVFLEHNYNKLIALDSGTIVKFLFICVNILILNLLCVLYMSSQTNNISIKYRFMMFGIFLNSIVEFHWIMQQSYNTEKIAGIIHIVSVLCITAGGLIEVYEFLYSKNIAKYEQYNNIGKIKMYLCLLIIPVIASLHDETDFPQGIVYFLLIIATHYVVSRYVQNSVKMQKLIQENELLVKAIKQSPVAIVITDLNGKIEFSNPFFSKMSGYSQEELFGKNVSEYISKEVDIDFKSLWNCVTLGNTWKAEYVASKKDGKKYYGNSVVEPIKNENGEIKNYIFVSEDITEIKENQKNLEDTLRIANEAMKAKTMFIANMSHEIRTPLNAIIGMTYLVLRTNLDSTQKEYISKINTSGKSLLGILNGILDFSKIDSGKFTLDKNKFSLETTLSHVICITSPNASKKGIEVELQVEDDIPDNLIGDSLRIEQVLTNLIGNAIKFTEKGKVLLSINKVSSKDNKIKLKFRIADTGIGMTKEQLNDIFKPFTQADGSTTRKYGGTGLGLTISQQLVEMMGGMIQVESEHTKGSVFYFSIWLEVSEQKAFKVKYSLNNEIKYDFSGLRVLIEDKDDINREICSDLLKTNGFDVQTAKNRKDFLDKYNVSSYDILLIEMSMSDSYGFEVIKQIRKSNNDIPIIAITTERTNKVREMCFKSGVNGCITKPYEPQKLFAVVSRWLRNKKKIFNMYVSRVSDVEMQNKSKQKLDEETAQSYIRYLERLLVDSDSEAVDYFRDKKDILTCSLKKENIHKMENLINNFQFDEALNLLRREWA